MNEIMSEEPELLYRLQVDTLKDGRQLMVSHVRYFVVKPNGSLMYSIVGQNEWLTYQLKGGEFLNAKVMKR